MNKIILSARLNRKRIFSAIYYYLFLIFAAIALLNPKWGSQTSNTRYQTDYLRLSAQAGIDTVFAIDVSRSMDIRDIFDGRQSVPVSRLEYGLGIAKESVMSLTGGRFAAAVGRGTGYLSIPLTYGNEAVLNYLESLDNRSVTGRSTNLQSLIEAAITAFQETSAARRVIVLVSDGEAHFGVLKNALNNCIKDNITVITVGVGSDEGAPVPGIAEEPAPVSSRDAQTMRMIAERTGGLYIDGNREDAGAVLTSHLLSLSHGASADNQSIPKQRRAPSGRLFVILAGLFYGASKFSVRTLQSGASGRSKRNTAAAFIILLLSSCSEGKLLLIEANYLYSLGRYDEAFVSYYKALNHEDAAPYAEYGLGLTYHSTDESLTALNRYLNSQEKLKNLPVRKPGSSPVLEHRELVYRNYYNSGIIYFEEGDFDSAAAAFKEALKADPSRMEAKRNLEISLMTIARDTAKNKQQNLNNETKELLFQIIQQQEQKNWRSGEWTEEHFPGPDY